MKRKLIWIAAALALVAIPAVIGLIAFNGDSGSSSASRKVGALVDAAKGPSGASLVIDGVTPVGKAIDVESVQWGVAQIASAVAVGGAGAGKANFSEVSVVKLADETSAKLLEACATGQHLKGATLSLKKEAGSQPYLVIKLTDVIISGVSMSHGGGGGNPSESVGLNYAKVEYTYTEQKPDGSLGTPTRMGYDLKLNKGA
jgi:type VI secretion system secreted protein Hcp